MFIFLFFITFLHSEFSSKEFVGSKLSFTPGFEKRKSDFLKEYGYIYGYNGKIDNLRRTQLPHLSGHTYVDYTGAGLYQKQQIEKSIQQLELENFGNPHSINPSSHHSTEVVDKTRKLILDWFNADPKEYTVVFTAGTSAALKLVGESFPWTKLSTFTYTRFNHNSVLGIREYAHEHDAAWKVVDYDELVKDYTPNRKGTSTKHSVNGTTSHLFAYPATCNYSGVKYPLDLITMIQNGSLVIPGHENGNTYIILDAAAFVPTARLDLTAYPADFVPVSFYKMFGYPTGLGALIAKTESLKRLDKKFFGGGTVSITLADEPFRQWMPELSSRYEDGTISFLGIAALEHGFDALRAVGIDRITEHVFTLTDYTYNRLSEMKHANGKPLFEIYGHHELSNAKKQGPVINFNLRDKTGEYFGFYDISVLAAKNNLHLRTGCSCNPGACYQSLNVPKEVIQEVVSRINKNACGERLDIVDGYAIGSIRVSFGYLSGFEDADAVVQFFRQFLNKTAQQFLDEMELKYPSQTSSTPDDL